MRNLFANAVSGAVGGLNPEVLRVMSAIFMSIGQDIKKASDSCKRALTVESRQ